MGAPAKTRLTKTGEPVMGTTIEVQCTDDTWEQVKVVGKGWSKGRQALVMAVLEWDDGSRSIAQPFTDLVWRRVALQP